MYGFLILLASVAAIYAYDVRNVHAGCRAKQDERQQKLQRITEEDRAARFLAAEQRNKDMQRFTQ